MALTQAQSALVDSVLRKAEALDAPGSNIIQSQAAVYALLEEAARLLIHEVPLRLLHPLVADATADVNLATYQHHIQADGHTKIVLPSDFARLVHLELNGWTVGRTHEDLHEDSIVTYRRYLRGETATTGDPRIFRTWLPARYQGTITFADNPSNLDTVTIGDQTWTFLTIIDTAGSDINIMGSLAATIAGFVDALNAAGLYAGVRYGTATEALETGIATGTATTITVLCDAAEAVSASADTWDVSTLALVSQGEAIDCFPASGGDADALVTAFNYIPDTAPESMPVQLSEAMQWRAASLLMTAADPQLSQLCMLRSQEALAPRIMRHRSAFTVQRRGLGL